MQPGAAVPAHLRDSHIDKKLVIVMAIATAFAVSNIYYNQPLLASIMKDFNISQRTAGYLPMVTQLGYALGLLLAVPAGDMLERKRLILRFLLVCFAMLIIVSASPSFIILLFASFLMGVFSVVPQMLLPMAASLASPEERGKVVGQVMSGLLIGILLSRTYAGFVNEHLGWRGVYGIASLFMLVIWIALYFLLPATEPTFKGSYMQLLRSILQLVRELPSLRESILIGICLFAALNIFWSVLIFLLGTPPYHYGSATAGLMGLLGAGGALAAPLFGGLADRKGPRLVIRTGIFLEIISFVILLFFGFRMAGLIAFVVLVDLAQQASQVSNQSKIFSLRPEARSRLNTAYMFSCFMGAASGSAIGSWAWHFGGLTAICTCGLVLLLLALCVFFLYAPKKTS